MKQSYLTEEYSTRTSMPMSPEILARFERFSARRTRERPVRRVDPLVKSHGRRVLEALATMTTLALIQVAVAVQVVFLEVYTQLKADVTLLTAERSLLSDAITTAEYWLLLCIQTVQSHGTIENVTFIRIGYKVQFAMTHEINVHLNLINF